MSRTREPPARSMTALETSVPQIDRKKLVVQQQARVEELRRSKYQSVLERHDEYRV